MPTPLAAQDLTPAANDEQISARLSGNAWDLKATDAGPLTIVPTDHSTLMKTRLSRLGAHNQRQQQDKFNAAQTATPYKLVKPKPQPSPKHAVDVWTRTKIHSSAMGAPNPGYDGLLGADIKLNRNVLLGTSAQLEEKRSSAGSTQESYLISPYVAMNLSPNLKLDAKTAWGAQRADTHQAQPQIQKRTTSARLSGHWNWNTLTIAPSAAIVHNKQTPSASPQGATPASAPNETTKLDVRPEVRRPFHLDGGDVIEPYVNLSGSVDLQNIQPDDTGSSIDRVGAGVTYTNPSNYKLKAATDIENLDSHQAPDVKGRIILTVPLD